MKQYAKYRMYIDEVGNSDLKSSADYNHRYLSLTGVIINLDYIESVLWKQMEQLKADFFGGHPDDPVILHRKELINRKPPFGSLKNQEAESEFNKQLLSFLANWEYIVVTVVIDKQEHLQRYAKWHYDPYHYCLAIIVERYVLWLQRKGVVGDVMAESRGGREDRRLKDSFRRLAERGTDYVDSSQIASRLTSKELKVKNKANNISGLQLADLIAYPSFRFALSEYQGIIYEGKFGLKICSILREAKYNRSPDGNLTGWGIKWLP
jgi:hypothetical protein